MITCIINGHKAYPISTSSIKVTYANQYVTDDGEYTYDITFPMNILENRVIFKNVSRLEVKKNIAKYDDCKLYCNGKIIMSGVGTVLSINQKEVKMQIVGGKSRIKFNDRMTKHYIDEIDMGESTPPGAVVDKSAGFHDILYKLRSVYRLDTDKTKFLGVSGKWCYVPCRDETYNLIANFVGVDRTGNLIGSKDPYITNIAVQPNLMYILRKVVEHEGYRLLRNDFDVSPWNQLYIASAYKTQELRKALPHWSAYTFIEEFRKLFNATVYFDDMAKTCKIIKASELTTVGDVNVEPLEEYTGDYDSDGSFTTSSTANLQYNLGEAANRDEYESISQKVFDNFPVFNSFDGFGPYNQFEVDTNGWDEKKKRTTIIRWQGSYYIYVEDTDGNRSWQLAGVWSPLVRDPASDDYTDLNISPAAQVVEDVEFKSSIFENKHQEKRYMLSIPNDKESDAKDNDTDDDGLSYVSVQDALDDDSSLDDSEDDQECMNIFFYLPGRVQKYENADSFSVSWVGEKSRWPHFITDCRINVKYRSIGHGSIDLSNPYRDIERSSLSLNPYFTAGNSIGLFHKTGYKIDNKNSLEIKFKSDKIPDPSDIYIIRGKRFVCEKVEVEIKNDGIEPIMTGTFYMLT